MIRFAGFLKFENLFFAIPSLKENFFILALHTSPCQNQHEQGGVEPSVIIGLPC